MLARVKQAMVSATPSWSLSSMAVAPNSFGRRGQSLGSRNKKIWGVIFGHSVRHRPETHCHVLFDLLVEQGEAFLAVLQCSAGLVQPHHPLCKDVFLQVFVGQSQCSQALSSKFLSPSRRYRKVIIMSYICILQWQTAMTGHRTSTRLISQSLQIPADIKKNFWGKRMLKSVTVYDRE